VLGVLLLVAVDVLVVVAARIALDTRYPGDIMAGILACTVALTLFAWFTSPGGRVQQPAAGTHPTDLDEALEAESVREAVSGGDDPAMSVGGARGLRP
jgi:hypothetical protein